MKTLIAEDDFTSRVLLEKCLKIYGPVHTAATGKEAVDAVRAALEAEAPYDLICLDILMPEMDGQEALKLVRAMEDAKGIKRARIVMTTALGDRQSVMQALQGRCDYFMIKPVRRTTLLEELRRMSLIA